MALCKMNFVHLHMKVLPILTTNICSWKTLILVLDLIVGSVRKKKKRDSGGRKRGPSYCRKQAFLIEINRCEDFLKVQQDNVQEKLSI